MLGPPGSGKSTYCQGMQQFLGGLSRRPILVNLDPANERPGYEPDLAIDELKGGMIYCMEHLAAHLDDWLKPKLEALLQREKEREGASPIGPYFVFDCPGQVELYTHNEAMLDIISFLVKMDFRVLYICVYS